LNKLTNKKDYSRKRTRDDSLVLTIKTSTCPMPPTPRSFSVRNICFESCRMHSTILESESIVLIICFFLKIYTARETLLWYDI
jgi:hypothetical protein